MHAFCLREQCTLSQLPSQAAAPVTHTHTHTHTQVDQFAGCRGTRRTRLQQRQWDLKAQQQQQAAAASAAATSRQVQEQSQAAAQEQQQQQQHQQQARASAAATSQQVVAHQAVHSWGNQVARQQALKRAHQHAMHQCARADRMRDVELATAIHRKIDNIVLQFIETNGNPDELQDWQEFMEGLAREADRQQAYLDRLPPARRPASDDSSLPCPHEHSGALAECAHCGAMLLEGEPPSMCCGNGQVILPGLKPPPAALQSLFKQKKWMSDIRRYNSQLAFTSTQCNDDKSVFPHFKIQGRLFHRIGAVGTLAGAKQCAQLYVHDEGQEEELKQRLLFHANSKSPLNASVMRVLQQALHELPNPYIQLFQTATKRINDMGSQGHDVEHCICIAQSNTPDPRVYNAPTANSEIGSAILISY